MIEKIKSIEKSKIILFAVIGVYAYVLTMQNVMNPLQK